jgi:hypothetical protein
MDFLATIKVLFKGDKRKKTVTGVFDCWLYLRSLLENEETPHQYFGRAINPFFCKNCGERFNILPPCPSICDIPNITVKDMTHSLTRHPFVFLNDVEKNALTNQPVQVYLPL